MTPLQERQVDVLLKKMDIDMESEIVPVQVESYSRPLQCYSNVAEKIKYDGGKIHYGWSVHITRILCEAERHAVWENDNEDLLCVTPHPYDKSEIIFIPDNTPVDPLDQIDNIRTNITSNPIVNDFIYVCETIGDLYRRFTKRKNDEQVTVESDVLEVIKKLEYLKNVIYTLVQNKMKENTVCFCASGKKYLQCHSSIIRRGIASDVALVEKIVNNRNI